MADPADRLARRAARLHVLPGFGGAQELEPLAGGPPRPVPAAEGDEELARVLLLARLQAVRFGQLLQQAVSHLRQLGRYRDPHRSELLAPGRPVGPVLAGVDRLQRVDGHVGQRERAHAAGVARRVFQADRAAEAVPDQVGALDAEVVEEGAEVAGHVGRRVARGRHGAQPVPAQVVHRDPVAPRQRLRDAREPERQVRGDAVHQDQVRSLPDALVVDTRPVQARQRHRRSHSRYPSARRRCMTVASPSASMAAASAGTSSGAWILLAGSAAAWPTACPGSKISTGSRPSNSCGTGSPRLCMRAGVTSRIDRSLTVSPRRIPGPAAMKMPRGLWTPATSRRVLTISSERVTETNPKSRRTSVRSAAKWECGPGNASSRVITRRTTRTPVAGLVTCRRSPAICLAGCARSAGPSVLK